MSQGLPYQLVGAGECRDANKEEYPYVTLWNQLIGTIQCADWCQQKWVPVCCLVFLYSLFILLMSKNRCSIFANLVGFEYGTADFVCKCDFSGGLPVPRPKYNPEATAYFNLGVGSGPILSAIHHGPGNPYCYKFIVVSSRKEYVADCIILLLQLIFSCTTWTTILANHCGVH